MLRPLFHLCAIVTLTCAAPAPFYAHQVNISSCPITFYQKTYQQLYLNESESLLTICFNDFYDPESHHECIIIPAADNYTQIGFEIKSSNSSYASLIKDNVKTITKELDCYVHLSMMHNSKPYNVRLVNFGTQAALHLDLHVKTTKFALVVVSRLHVSNVTIQPPHSSAFLDISGCRFIGAFLERNASMDLSDICKTASCGVEGNVTLTQGCDERQSCTLDQCSILKEAPFSSCNSSVDPELYISVCKETVCNHPDVDGLRCRFLEAYARACSGMGKHLPDSWKTEAQCSPSETGCQDRTCSDHEFCGVVGGASVCLCKEGFASRYNESGALGNPMVCSENSASVSLAGCLLEGQGINSSHLHLNDPSCKGEMDEETHMLTFSFNRSNICGAMITTNGSHITYKATIKSENRSSDVITRQNEVEIDFTCVYTKPETKTVVFRIKDSSVVQSIASGPWSYTVAMTAYTDAAHTRAVDSSTEVRLNQKIWLKLETDGLDADTISMVTDSCWATAEQSDNSTPRYNLIQNGCANSADRSIQVEGNGRGTYNYFSFNMFQFSRHPGEIFLHCKLKLCVRNNNNCVPSCGGGSGRRRRSARPSYGGEAATFISMARAT
ncbi:alpha-tectorin-like [Cololabis saira]|uniref:alpha-tectorin-like n=1 Tax=Cololabis saira TaxID=129043 RepID=UPI002AD4316A|nr:alpha-tectorin-like [Cololabis saira]